ncbi:NADH-quinone oxidoreductase subunit C [Desulforamulus ruminis]|uniref:NADH dehydrogenase (Ubiquinone) 30 kDa subunit n=1 Tax=Desulforamulus ruminis (strain ATCC 23193 / DSM 2154 / NCIMB 8452 / DL) TaxID=696281 RepID=F6DVL0_DESRL|nr:NADH-quinone oxidoreductase subunit C [Desulforamulus ruminis]AEG61470.1 NADH dehydrogenase (ubiquinone) 30 kDa subunit [Desulforamulus ruminis DSM 2154]
MSSDVLWREIQKHPELDVTQVSSLGGAKTWKLGVPLEKLPEITGSLKEMGARLLTLSAIDERELNRHFALCSAFALPLENTLVEIRVLLDGANPRYPSVTMDFPSAHWLEREVKDMFGIVPEGHPDLRRVAVHPDWPGDLFPLRKDFISGTKVPRVPGKMEFCPVEGEGLYQAPVGPVHAGIIEPGHFRFFTFGEDVINLQAQLFYTHRGIEKTAEGMHFLDAALVAERICGVCSASHAASYAQAIESLADVAVPGRARFIRSILLEMERLYNHVGDIGNVCAGIGFSYAISRGALLKEQLMRMNLRLTGHRYLRGTILPGGVTGELKDLPVIMKELERLQMDLKELTTIMLSSQSLLDRMHTTGILTRETAATLGAVGPAARASSIDCDLRRDLPYAAYNQLSFQIPLQTGGDVLCRLKQRIDECEQSFSILKQSFKHLAREEGPLCVEVPYLPPYQTAVGYSESARGANVHLVVSGPDNTLFRYMVRSASHCNWPVVPLCVPGNIIPDFPLINKSFELCYACLDR